MSTLLAPSSLTRDLRVLLPAREAIRSVLGLVVDPQELVFDIGVALLTRVECLDKGEKVVTRNLVFAPEVLRPALGSKGDFELEADHHWSSLLEWSWG